MDMYVFSIRSKIEQRVFNVLGNCFFITRITPKRQQSFKQYGHLSGCVSEKMKQMRVGEQLQ